MQSRTLLHPLVVQTESFRARNPDLNNVYASGPRLVSEANTSASTAACAACFAGKIAWPPATSVSFARENPVVVCDKV